MIGIKVVVPPGQTKAAIKAMNKLGYAFICVRDKEVQHLYGYPDGSLMYGDDDKHFEQKSFEHWGLTESNDGFDCVPLYLVRITPTKDTNPKDAIGDTKVPLWLCSVIAKTEWALAQFAGMCKYGAWNWRETGVRSSVYLSAMERHLSAYLCGEELDPVDGTKHLGNIMACCAIILDAEAAGKLTDDRPPAINFRDNFKAAEAQMAKLREQYKDKHPHHHTIMDKK